MKAALKTLGYPMVMRGGEDCMLPAKAVALLAYIADCGVAGCVVNRAANLLWEGSEQANHRSLNQAVYAIRKAVGHNALTRKGDRLWINQDVIDADITTLEEALRSQDIHRVRSVYAGDFLDVSNVVFPAQFDDWRFAKAASIKKRISALERHPRLDVPPAVRESKLNWPVRSTPPSRPLLGRDDENDHLLSFLLTPGPARCALITGSPGIGKARWRSRSWFDYQTNGCS
jgi:hypothetical protein